MVLLKVLNKNFTQSRNGRKGLRPQSHPHSFTVGDIAFLKSYFAFIKNNIKIEVYL